VLFVPKHDAEHVVFASASTASGLPSTFSLVYGSVFGVTSWLRGVRAVAITLRA